MGIRPNILHTCWNTTISNIYFTYYYHACANNKYALKCHIYTTYANSFMCRYERTMSVYVPHMNSLQSTVWPEACIYIYQYWHMLINKYACHITNVYPTVLILYPACRAHNTAHVSKRKQMATLITMQSLYMCQQQTCNLNVTYMQHVQISSWLIWDNYVSIYT